MEILIVEDDERMAALLKRGLEREGHVAEVTTDGLEGFEFALLRLFDVVILDLRIPSMNGFEVSRRLRERGVRTPILVLTARDERGTSSPGSTPRFRLYLKRQGRWP